MLVRYSAAVKGQVHKKAVVYTAKEHSIPRSDIDPDAARIVKRLRSMGHEAYIVGGAVRDLLAGKKPKDFDVVTDAAPRQIKRIFRNSRIIGKRFRLVHIFFPDKIIEVSTFRALAEGETNVFGSIEEDVQRRDFTLNALYYCPIEGIIIDYIGGVKDIRKKKVAPLIPLRRIFTEDPVRMIRAVKYSAGLGFGLPFLTRRKIKAQASLLEGISGSRLTEELFKILQSGKSAVIFRELYNLNLLKYFLPALDGCIRETAENFRDSFFATLQAHDDSIRSGMERTFLLAPLIQDYVKALLKKAGSPKPLFKDVYSAVKKMMQPLVPANRDIDMALIPFFRRKKQPRTQRRRPASGTSGQPNARAGQSGASGPMQHQPSPKSQSASPPSPQRTIV
ncbi:MAG: polynucleotide adenylyltransferase PcnB [Spirochaetales bacterium]|nr:polynucleotide adenylyltransferase PcnB [Spirochaetales bacterium]